MLEFIGEFLVQLFTEGIITGLMKLIKLIGLIIYKLITFNKKSIPELWKAYEESPEPYSWGCLFIIFSTILIYLGTFLF